MLDQPLEEIIKKKKKDGSKKKTPKSGIPTTPKTGKKLNKPEGKGIVKPTKTPKTQQATQTRTPNTTRGGKTASKVGANNNNNRGGATNTRSNTQQNRGTQTATRGTTSPRGSRGAAGRGGAVGRGGVANRGAKGTTRGGIRPNVMTQPRPDTPRQNSKTNRGNLPAIKPVTKNNNKKADLLATKMSISIVNDQFQPQAQLPQVQTQAPQVHYQAPEDVFVRGTVVKNIEFEEVDSTGTTKLKSLDAIFKSINSGK